MSQQAATPECDWDLQVRQALEGSELAWRELVDRLSDVVWKVLNSYSLDQADKEEAFAATFFRLYQKLDTVREPKRLPGWVATATRNEANSIWRSRKRTVPTDKLGIYEVCLDSTDKNLLDAELLQQVMDAFGKLPADGQALLRLMTTVPPLSYKEIAELLDIPMGSIGPMAGRHLAKLRRLLYSYDSGGST